MIVTLGSLVFIVLLVTRYRRGDDRPFARPGKHGKRVLALTNALAFVGFMVWANRPLP